MQCIVVGHRSPAVQVPYCEGDPHTETAHVLGASRQWRHTEIACHELYSKKLSS